MAETYDSVVDRIGAFNQATERMSKGQASSVECIVTAQPDRRLRLVRTDDNYRLEVAGEVPADKEGVLAALKFSRTGEMYGRDIRRVERSWNVASEMEDILSDVFGLPPSTGVSVEIVLG